MWPIVAGGIGGIVSTMMTNQANQQNVNQMEQFQAGMADTQYQRSVADMKAAGLNPAMMFGGGGGLDAAPTGGAANFQAPSVAPWVQAASSQDIAEANLQLQGRQQNNQDTKTAVDVANTAQDTKLKEAATQLAQKGLTKAGAQSDLWDAAAKGIKGLRDMWRSPSTSPTPGSAGSQDSMGNFDNWDNSATVHLGQ